MRSEALAPSSSKEAEREVFQINLMMALWKEAGAKAGPANPYLVEACARSFQETALKGHREALRADGRSPDEIWRLADDFKNQLEACPLKPASVYVRPDGRVSGWFLDKSTGTPYVVEVHGNPRTSRVWRECGEFVRDVLSAQKPEDAGMLSRLRSGLSPVEAWMSFLTPGYGQDFTAAAQEFLLPIEDVGSGGMEFAGGWMNGASLAALQTDPDGLDRLFAQVSGEAKRADGFRIKRILRRLRDFRSRPETLAQFLEDARGRLEKLAAGIREDARVMGLEMPGRIHLVLRVGSNRFSTFHKENDHGIITVDAELLLLDDVPEEALRFFLAHEMLHAAVAKARPGWSASLAEAAVLFGGVAMLWQRGELSAVRKFLEKLRDYRQFGQRAGRFLAGDGALLSGLLKLEKLRRQSEIAAQAGGVPPEAAARKQEELRHAAMRQTSWTIRSWLAREPTFREDMAQMEMILARVPRLFDGGLENFGFTDFLAFLDTSDERTVYAIAREILGPAAVASLVEEGRPFQQEAERGFNILLTGEDGLHRKLLGKLVHHIHRRKDPGRGAMVTIDAREIREGDLARLLDPDGPLMQKAKGGTVFIHLLEELSPKDLRYLAETIENQRNEGEVPGVPRRHDARFVFSSNLDLAAAERAGIFPTDVYYKLGLEGHSYKVPPLRERSREERQRLIELLLRRYAGKEGKTGLSLAPAALDLLLNHDWPGNIFEMDNVLRRAAVLARMPAVQAHDILLGNESYPYEPSVLQRLAKSDMHVLLYAPAARDAEHMVQKLIKKRREAGRPLQILDARHLEGDGARKLLFGDADAGVKGVLEQANGGAILVENVDLLPEEGQRDLLEILRSGGFSKNKRGGTREALHVQWYFTATRNLAELVRSGRLFPDLYYAMSEFTLEIPPLSLRKGELEAMAREAAGRAAAHRGRKAPAIDPGVFALLAAHPWPGGVGQLEAVMESAVVLSPGDRITKKDLPDTFLRSLERRGPPDQGLGYLELLLPREEIPSATLADPVEAQKFSAELAAVLETARARFTASPVFDEDAYPERALEWITRAFGTRAVAAWWEQDALLPLLKYLFTGTARDADLEKAVRVWEQSDPPIAAAFAPFAGDAAMLRLKRLEFLRMHRALLKFYLWGWTRDIPEPASRLAAFQDEGARDAMLLNLWVASETREWIRATRGRSHPDGVSLDLEEDTLGVLQLRASKAASLREDLWGIVLRGRKAADPGESAEEYFPLHTDPDRPDMFVHPELLREMAREWIEWKDLDPASVEIVAVSQTRGGEDARLYENISDLSLSAAPHKSDFERWGGAAQKDARAFAGEALGELLGKPIPRDGVPELISAEILGHFYAAGFRARDTQKGAAMAFSPSDVPPDSAPEEIEKALAAKHPRQLQEEGAAEILPVRVRTLKKGGWQTTRSVPAFLAWPSAPKDAEKMTKAELDLLDTLLHPNRDEFVLETAPPVKRGMAAHTDLTEAEESARNEATAELGRKIEEEISQLLDGTGGVLSPGQLNMLTWMMFDRQTQDNRAFLRDYYPDRRTDDPAILALDMEAMFLGLLEKTRGDEKKCRDTALLFAKLYGLLLRQHEADLELKFGNRHDAPHVATLLRMGDDLMRDIPLVGAEKFQAQYGPDGAALARLAILCHDLGYAPYVQIQRARNRIGQRAPPKGVHSGLSVRVVERELEPLLLSVFPELALSKPGQPGRTGYEDFKEAILFHSASREKDDKVTYDEVRNPLLFLTTLADKLDYRHDRVKPDFQSTYLFSKIQEYRDQLNTRGSAPALRKLIVEEVRRMREQDPGAYVEFLHSFGTIPVMEVQTRLMLGEKTLSAEEYALLNDRERSEARLVVWTLVERPIVELARDFEPDPADNPALFQVRRTLKALAPFSANEKPIEVRYTLIRRAEVLSPQEQALREKVLGELRALFGPDLVLGAGDLDAFVLARAKNRKLQSLVNSVKGLLYAFLPPRGGDATLLKNPVALYPFVLALAKGLPEPLLSNSLRPYLRKLVPANVEEDKALGYLADNPPDLSTWLAWARNYMAELLKEQKAETAQWTSASEWRGQLEPFFELLSRELAPGPRRKTPWKIVVLRPAFPPYAMMDLEYSLKSAAIPADISAADLAQPAYTVFLPNGDTLTTDAAGELLYFDLSRTRGEREFEDLKERAAQAYDLLHKKMRILSRVVTGRDMGVFRNRERVIGQRMKDILDSKTPVNDPAGAMAAVMEEAGQLASELRDQALIREDDLPPDLFLRTPSQRRWENLIPDLSERIRKLHAALSGLPDASYTSGDGWKIARVHVDPAEWYGQWMKRQEFGGIALRLEFDSARAAKPDHDLALALNPQNAHALHPRERIREGGQCFLVYGIRERRQRRGDNLAFVRYQKKRGRLMPQELCFTLYKAKDGSTAMSLEMQLSGVFPEEWRVAPLLKDLKSLQRRLRRRAMSEDARSSILGEAYLKMVEIGIIPRMEKDLLAFRLPRNEAENKWGGPVTAWTIRDIVGVARENKRPEMQSLALHVLGVLYDGQRDPGLRADILDAVIAIQLESYPMQAWLRAGAARWVHAHLDPPARVAQSPALLRKEEIARMLLEAGAALDTLGAREWFGEVSEERLSGFLEAVDAKQSLTVALAVDAAESYVASHEKKTVELKKLEALERAFDMALERANDSETAARLAAPYAKLLALFGETQEMEILWMSLLPHARSVRSRRAVASLMEAMTILAQNTDPARRGEYERKAKKPEDAAWLETLALAAHGVGLGDLVPALAAAAIPVESERKAFEERLNAALAVQKPVEPTPLPGILPGAGLAWGGMILATVVLAGALYKDKLRARAPPWLAPYVALLPDLSEWRVRALEPLMALAYEAARRAVKNIAGALGAAALPPVTETRRALPPAPRAQGGVTADQKAKDLLLELAVGTHPSRTLEKIREESSSSLAGPVQRLWNQLVYAAYGPHHLGRVVRLARLDPDTLRMAALQVHRLLFDAPLLTENQTIPVQLQKRLEIACGQMGRVLAGMDKEGLDGWLESTYPRHPRAAAILQDAGIPDDAVLDERITLLGTAEQEHRKTADLPYPEVPAGGLEKGFAAALALRDELSRLPWVDCMAYYLYGPMVHNHRLGFPQMFSDQEGFERAGAVFDSVKKRLEASGLSGKEKMWVLKTTLRAARHFAFELQPLLEQGDADVFVLNRVRPYIKQYHLGPDSPRKKERMLWWALETNQPDLLRGLIGWLVLPRYTDSKALPAEWVRAARKVRAGLQAAFFEKFGWYFHAGWRFKDGAWIKDSRVEEILGSERFQAGGKTLEVLIVQASPGNTTYFRKGQSYAWTLHPGENRAVLYVKSTTPTDALAGAAARVQRLLANEALQMKLNSPQTIVSGTLASIALGSRPKEDLLEVLPDEPPSEVDRRRPAVQAALELFSLFLREETANPAADAEKLSLAEWNDARYALGKTSPARLRSHAEAIHRAQFGQSLFLGESAARVRQAQDLAAAAVKQLPDEALLEEGLPAVLKDVADKMPMDDAAQEREQVARWIAMLRNYEILQRSAGNPDAWEKLVRQGMAEEKAAARIAQAAKDVLPGLGLNGLILYAEVLRRRLAAEESPELPAGRRMAKTRKVVAEADAMFGGLVEAEPLVSAQALWEGTLKLVEAEKEKRTRLIPLRERIKYDLQVAEHRIKKLALEDPRAYRLFRRWKDTMVEEAEVLPEKFRKAAELTAAIRERIKDYGPEGEAEFRAILEKVLAKWDKILESRPPGMRGTIDPQKLKRIMHDAPHFQILHENNLGSPPAAPADSLKSRMDSQLESAFLEADKELLSGNIFGNLQVRAPPNLANKRIRFVHHEELLNVRQHAEAWVDPADPDTIYITHEIWRSLTPRQRVVLLVHEIVESQALQSGFTPQAAHEAAMKAEAGVDPGGALAEKVNEILKDYRIYNGVDRIELFITHPHGDHSNYVWNYVKGGMRNLIGRLVPPLKEKMEMLLGNKFTHEVTSYMLRPTKRVLTIFDLGGYAGEGADPFIETVNAHFRVGNTWKSKPITIYADMYTANTLEFRKRVEGYQKQGFKVSLEVFDPKRRTITIEDSDHRKIAVTANPAFHLTQYIGSSIFTMKTLNAKGEQVSGYSLVSEIGDTLPYRMDDKALEDIARSDIIAIDGTNATGGPKESPVPVRKQDNKIHAFTDRLNRDWATVSHLNTTMIGSVAEALEASRTLNPDTPIVVFAGVDGIEQLKTAYRTSDKGTELLHQDGDLFYLDSKDIQKDSLGARIYLVNDMKDFAGAWRTQKTAGISLKDILPQRLRSYFVSGRNMEEVGEYLSDWAKNPGMDPGDFLWLFEELQKPEWEILDGDAVMQSYANRMKQTIRDYFDPAPALEPGPSLGQWHRDQLLRQCDAFVDSQSPRWQVMDKSQMSAALREDWSRFLEQAVRGRQGLWGERDQIGALAKAFAGVPTLGVGVQGRLLADRDALWKDAVKDSIDAALATAERLAAKQKMPESLRQEISADLAQWLNKRSLDWRMNQPQSMPFMILEETQRYLEKLAGQKPWESLDSDTLMQQLDIALREHHEAGVTLNQEKLRGALFGLLGEGAIPQDEPARRKILEYLSGQDREDPRVLNGLIKLLTPDSLEFNRDVSKVLLQREDGKMARLENRMEWLARKGSLAPAQAQTLMESWSSHPWINTDLQLEWIHLLLEKYEAAVLSDKNKWLGLGYENLQKQVLIALENRPITHLWPRQLAKIHIKLLDLQKFLPRSRSLKDLQDFWERMYFQFAARAPNQFRKEALLSSANLSPRQRNEFKTFEGRIRRKPAEKEDLDAIESALWETAKTGSGKLLTVGAGHFSSYQQKATQLLNQLFPKRYAEILVEGRPRFEGRQGRVSRGLFKEKEMYLLGKKRPVLARREHQWMSGHITFDETVKLLEMIYNKRVELGLVPGGRMIPERGLAGLSEEELRQFPGLDGVRVVITTSSKYVTPATQTAEAKIGQELSKEKRMMLGRLAKLFPGLELGAGRKTIGVENLLSRAYYEGLGGTVPERRESDDLRHLFERAALGEIPRDLDDLPNSKKAAEIAQDVQALETNWMKAHKKGLWLSVFDKFKDLKKYLQGQILRLGLRVVAREEYGEEYGSRRVIEQQEITGLHSEILKAFERTALAAGGQELLDYFAPEREYWRLHPPALYDSDGKVSLYLRNIIDGYSASVLVKAAVLIDPARRWAGKNGMAWRLDWPKDEAGRRELVDYLRFVPMDDLHRIAEERMAQIESMGSKVFGGRDYAGFQLASSGTEVTLKLQQPPAGSPAAPREFKYSHIPESDKIAVMEGMRRRGKDDVLIDEILMILEHLGYLARVEMAQKTVLGHPRVPFMMEKIYRLAGLPENSMPKKEDILYHDYLHILLDAFGIPASDLTDRFVRKLNIRGMDVRETLQFYATESGFVRYTLENGKRKVASKDWAAFLRSGKINDLVEEIMVDVLSKKRRAPDRPLQGRWKALHPLVEETLRETGIPRATWPRRRGDAPSNLWHLFAKKTRELGRLVQNKIGRRTMHTERQEEIAFLESVLDGLIATEGLQSKTVKSAADGTKIHYRIGGKPDAEKTLLFVHGWSGNVYHWIMQVLDLMKDYRIIVVDTRGHGRTPLRGLPAQLLTELTPRDILSILDAEGIWEGVVPVGHSAGGMALQEMLKKIYKNPQESLGEKGSWKRKKFGDYRDVFDAMVLVNTTPKPPKQTSYYKTGMIGAFAPMLIRAIPFLTRWTSLPENYLVSLKTHRQDTSLLEKQVNKLILTGKNHLAFDFFFPISMEAPKGLEGTPDEGKPYAKISFAWEGMSHHDTEDILARIDIPVLVAHGDQDGFTEFKEVWKYFQNIPNVYLLFFEGQKHVLHFEDHPNFNKGLREFLKRVKGRRKPGTPAWFWGGAPLPGVIDSIDLYLYAAFVFAGTVWLYRMFKHGEEHAVSQAKEKARPLLFNRKYEAYWLKVLESVTPEERAGLLINEIVDMAQYSGYALNEAEKKELKLAAEKIQRLSMDTPELSELNADAVKMLPPLLVLQAMQRSGLLTEAWLDKQSPKAMDMKRGEDLRSFVKSAMKMRNELASQLTLNLITGLDFRRSVLLRDHGAWLARHGRDPWGPANSWVVPDAMILDFIDKLIDSQKRIVEAAGLPEIPPASPSQEASELLEASL